MAGVATATLAEGLAGKRVPFDRVPVIDVGPLVDGSDPMAVADEIGRACRDVGFLYVRNHGVEARLVESVFADAKRFFDLPLDAKMAVHINKSPCHRGYFPLFEENTDPDLTADYKEGFDTALDLPADDPDVLAGVPLYGPNQWPDDLPGFRETVTGYWDEMARLARLLLRGFALSLDIDEDFFVDKVDKPMAQVRLLHYPPQGGLIEEETLGCGAHSDYGCLTILAQDENGGLQLQNSAGDWISAPPVPGAFVVNIGDQMARWTNGLFAATRHRVINASGRERYSIPFFFDPNFHTLVECLETCQGPDNPPRYPPVLAGDYLLSRFNDTFQYRAGEEPSL